MSPTRSIIMAALSITLAGCSWQWPWQPRGEAEAVPADTFTQSGGDYGAGPPLGGVPGGLIIAGEPNMANPRESDRESASKGHRLFLAMNCASCHGYDAKGAMGPDLTDQQWRYAGTPAAIFNSIAQGRPQGMPSWGKTLPEDQIWNIVSYIETLGGTYKPGQYNASLEGDTDRTQVSAGLAQLESIISNPQPSGAQQPASTPAQSNAKQPAPAATQSSAKQPAPAATQGSASQAAPAQGGTSQ